MTHHCLAYLLILIFLLGIVHGVSKSPQPEQIHISLTGDPTEMVVTWTTLAPTHSSFVEYGFRGQPLTNRVEGESSKYITCGWKKRPIWIHRAKLGGLVPTQSYDYRCGGDNGWSALYMFNATKAGTEWSPSLAVYGDLGVGNAMSLAKLQREVQSGHYDAILHVGDFAYDMASDESRVGDAFMNQIETMAAYTPYMVCPGNHEHACNFSNYRKRFSMPGNTEGIFYSWNIGPAHIVSFSTELYYFLQYGIEQLVQQYKWLQRDLEEANLPHNRAQRPWIITMGHRPMYCSNIVGDGCERHENAIRTGITSLKLFPLEELFYKHGVDLQLYGHEHSYERLFPVYQHRIYKGSEEQPYTNPKAPVHLISGSAGCKYCHDDFSRDYGPWTAFRTLDYGFTRMKIHNRTHLYFEQVSIDKDYKVIDKVWIRKDKHGPAAWSDCLASNDMPCEPQPFKPQDVQSWKPQGARNAQPFKPQGPWNVQSLKPQGTQSVQPFKSQGSGNLQPFKTQGATDGMMGNTEEEGGSRATISKALSDMIKNYYHKLKRGKDPYL